MDFLSHYSKNTNKIMYLRNKNCKFFSAQVKKDTNEGNKLGSLEENKIKKPFVFQSKFQNLDYVFPEDKNLKKFMLKDDDRILWRKLSNHREVPFYFKRLKLVLWVYLGWKMGTNLDFFTTTFNSKYYYDSWFNSY